MLKSFLSIDPTTLYLLGSLVDLPHLQMQFMYLAKFEVLIYLLIPFTVSRSSYPDHKGREEPDETEELPSEKTLDYDDETMELILPSGMCICQK